MIDKAVPLVNFKQVLSYLNPKEIQRTSLVSRSWKKASFDVVNGELSRIRQFAKFLRENLQIEIDEKISCSNEIDKKILDSENLKQVQSSIDRMKINIFNVLKKLKEEDLKNLEKVLRDKNKSIFLKISLILLEFIKDLIRLIKLIILMKEILHLGRFRMN